MTVTDRDDATPDASAAPAGSDPETGETASTAGDKPGSLLPVIRVIPDEAYDNPTWKGLAYFARDLVIYGAVVTGLVLTNNPILLVVLWILAALAISGLFIIGHDAAHEALFAKRRTN